MIPKQLWAMWTAIAPALGDHLWQSTLFAVLAGLLTLILRKSQAGARYWLWLAASMKFLVPFSLLVGIGSHLAWSRGFAGSKAGLYFAMEEVSQPFTQAAIPAISPATSSAVFPSLIHLLPALLAAVWLCGFAAVLAVWYARWQRISAAMRDAVPISEGREVEAWRRLESHGATRIEMLLSRASLEPGIFGIVQPVLLWPEGISARLEDAHLEAILAHELRHVRRRDNLAAAAHMLVEAIFWFHPLVWWLGARLVEERERACDEEVLELGRDRQVYAESILKVCEFCVGPPRACVSGVTGADLKKRIVHIMSENVARKLDFSRKLLLSAAVLAVIALPIVLGLFNAPQSRAQSQADNLAAITPAYQVTSIKAEQSDGKVRISKVLVTPNGVSLTGVTVRALIHFAYGVGDQQISGGPAWLDSGRYDIEAKTDKSVADELRSLSEVQRKVVNQRMLEGLLADQFKLTLHSETKELQQYALAIAPGGPKLHEAKPGDTYPNGIKDPDGFVHSGMMRMGPGMLIGQGTSLEPLVGQLSYRLGRTVIDNTGLTGNYDFTLRWVPDANEEAQLKSLGGGPPDSTSPAASGPPLSTAIQEQLGLELQPQTGPVQILVIDHAEMPAEN